MPNLDKTGPMGQGKMSGRGLGKCGNGANSDGRIGFGAGIGFGRGMGFGGRRGRGRCMMQAITQAISLSSGDQINILNERLKEIGEEKTAIESKLNELK